jgi:hypothetical protein
MTFILRSFPYSSDFGYGPHDEYYWRATEWLEGRYGSKFVRGIKTSSIDDDAWIDGQCIRNVGAGVWEQQLAEYSLMGILLPHNLHFLQKCYGDDSDIAIWDTEREVYPIDRPDFPCRRYHDIVVVVPSDVDAVEFKLVVG